MHLGYGIQPLCFVVIYVMIIKWWRKQYLSETTTNFTNISEGNEAEKNEGVDDKMIKWHTSKQGK